MHSLSEHPFREDLLRMYLGKYEGRFRLLKEHTAASDIVLCTDPHPILVVTFEGVWVSLLEYVEIEKEDPFSGIFDYYQIEIVEVPLCDPEGFQKVEKAITRSYLSGTKS